MQIEDCTISFFFLYELSMFLKQRKKGTFTYDISTRYKKSNIVGILEELNIIIT